MEINHEEMVCFIYLKIIQFNQAKFILKVQANLKKKKMKMKWCEKNFSRKIQKRLISQYTNIQFSSSKGW